MKLIVCLSVLSMMMPIWSTDDVEVRTSRSSRHEVVIGDYQIGPPPGMPMWGMERWAEREVEGSRGRRSKRRRRGKRKAAPSRSAMLGKSRLRQGLWRRRRREKARTQQVGRPGVGDLSAVQAEEEGRVSATACPGGGQGIEAPRLADEGMAGSSPAVERKRGRPRSIVTDDRCCPHEDCEGYERFGNDPKHDIVGCGTYPTAKGEVGQLYRCNICRRRFSATAGTPLFGLKTPTRTVCIALQELTEGLGIRAVARIHGVKPNVVLEWLRKAGRHGRLLTECMMQELDIPQVQVDEMWTFVRKKEQMLTEWEKLHTEWGDTWIWVAFDPLHKLVIAVLVGERGQEEAIDFLTRLRDCLAAACHPLLTSDSLPHYVRAILQVFGVWIQPQRQGTRGRFPNPRPVPSPDLQYATVHKERQNGRVIAITTQIIYGNAEQLRARLDTLGQTINTSFVERINLTLRHLISRLHRKTLCFSKQRDYLVDHLHLALAYYHFSRYHAGLRIRLPEPIPTRGNGSPKLWQQRTPAMAAGWTDHCWSMKELLMHPVCAAP
jgi:IS1 family transposase